MRWPVVLLFLLAATGCKSEKRKDFELICEVRAHAQRGEEQRRFLEANVKSPEAKQFLKDFNAMDGCKQPHALWAAAREAGLESCELLHEYGECSGGGEL